MQLRCEHITSPQALADAHGELEKLKADRRRIDEQIADATTVTQMPKADADTLVEQCMEKTKLILEEVSTLPKHLLRECLSNLVSKVVVDMETKAIEIHMALRREILETAVWAQKPMRFATTSVSLTDYETHHALASIGVIECKWIQRSNKICNGCQHKAAA